MASTLCLFLGKTVDVSKNHQSSVGLGSTHNLQGSLVTRCHADWGSFNEFACIQMHRLCKQHDTG